MWRWRDWVIDAFNRNLPYDRFTVEQIAGDLLPGATRDQIIATGFNRNHRANGEGGIIPEEYAVEYVVDRVDTTSTVLLGVTLGCARCHNHKFDPFTQKEFYQMFAYFNQVPERGNAFKYGNSPPVITAPPPEQEARLKAVEQKLAAAEQQASALEPEIGPAQTRLGDIAARAGASRLGALARRGRASASGRRSERRDHSRSAALGEISVPDGERPGAAAGRLHGEGRVERRTAQYGAGPMGAAGEFDGKRYVDVGNVGNFGFYDSFTLSAWINPAVGSGHDRQPRER